MEGPGETPTPRGAVQPPGPTTPPADPDPDPWTWPEHAPPRPDHNPPPLNRQLAQLLARHAIAAHNTHTRFTQQRTLHAARTIADTHAAQAAELHDWLDHQLARLDNAQTTHKKRQPAWPPTTSTPSCNASTAPSPDSPKPATTSPD